VQTTAKDSESKAIQLNAKISELELRADSAEESLKWAMDQMNGRGSIEDSRSVAAYPCCSLSVHGRCLLFYRSLNVMIQDAKKHLVQNAVQLGIPIAGLERNLGFVEFIDNFCISVDTLIQESKKNSSPLTFKPLAVYDWRSQINAYG